MRREDIHEISISDRVADKIWSKHNVTGEEIREVFDNEDEPLKIRRSDVVSGSYIALGRSYSGRYLMIALFPKDAGKVNIATARDMSSVERQAYRRK